jgi:putative addiction module component (TIGR02574 family)
LSAAVRPRNFAFTICSLAKAPALSDNPAMTTAQQALAKHVLKWPANRRIELVEELLASVDSFATPEIQAAWDEEIGARVKAIRAGGAEGIPAEEVMAEARQKLHEARGLSSARRQRTH